MLSRIHRALATARPRTRPFVSSSCRLIENVDPLLPFVPPPPKPKPVAPPPPKLSQDPHVFLDIPPAEDPLLRYIASSLLRDGRRHTAERRVKYLLLHLHAFTRSPPLPLVRDAIERAAPFVRVITHRKGGKNVIQPVPLTERQRVLFAMRWILDASNTKAGVTVEERLAREMLDVLKGESKALKRKTDVHHTAMVNRCVASTFPKSGRLTSTSMTVEISEYLRRSNIRIYAPVNPHRHSSILRFARTQVQFLDAEVLFECAAICHWHDN